MSILEFFPVGLLSRSIELAGEEPRSVSYGEELYPCTVDSVPLGIVRAVISIGYAFQDLQVGVECAVRSIEGISDAEDFEDIAIASLGVMGIALYQGRRAQALQLLDALLGKVQELDLDEIDPIFPYVLAAFFPERKEVLAPLISEEMPQLPELSPSLKCEDVLQTLSELSQVGLFDLGDAQTLSATATLLAVLN